MKKVFIVAMAALAFMGCNESKPADKAIEATNNTATTTNIVATNASDIAIVDVVYVVNQSEIAKTEGVALRNKIAKTEEKFAKKDQDIQKEMQQLAEKYQKGLITTRDAQAKEQELQSRAAALQEQAQKEVPALQEEEMVLNNRVNDLIQRAVQSINADKKYKLVINSAQLLGAVLDADESLNITEQVLAKVNELYAS
jgi:outer membrane protein